MFIYIGFNAPPINNINVDLNILFNTNIQITNKI